MPERYFEIWCRDDQIFKSEILKGNAVLSLRDVSSDLDRFGFYHSSHGHGKNLPSKIFDCCFIYKESKVVQFMNWIRNNGDEHCIKILNWMRLERIETVLKGEKEI